MADPGDKRICLIQAPLPVGISQQGVHVGVGKRLADDHQVDVAFAGVGASGDRSENERALDAVRQRRQGLPEDIGEPEGFPGQAAQLFENRRPAIGFEPDLPTEEAAMDQLRRDQPGQLPLDRSRSNTRQPHELVEVEAAWRLTKQQRQHPLLGAAEEGVG